MHQAPGPPCTPRSSKRTFLIKKTKGDGWDGRSRRTRSSRRSSAGFLFSNNDHATFDSQPEVQTRPPQFNADVIGLGCVAPKRSQSVDQGRQKPHPDPQALRLRLGDLLSWINIAAFWTWIYFCLRDERREAEKKRSGSQSE